MNENESLLKRLQDSNSFYNVDDWEFQRKENVKRIKNICYHPPSLLKHKKGKRRKSRKRGPRIDES